MAKPLNWVREKERHQRRLMPWLKKKNIYNWKGTFWVCTHQSQWISCTIFYLWAKGLGPVAAKSITKSDWRTSSGWNWTHWVHRVGGGHHKGKEERLTKTHLKTNLTDVPNGRVSMSSGSTRIHGVKTIPRPSELWLPLSTTTPETDLVERKGILSSPNPKPCHVLAREAADHVWIYKCNEVSWMLPGKRDFVSVKQRREWVHIQKKKALSNFREAYQLFKESFLLWVLASPSLPIFIQSTITGASCTRAVSLSS